MPKADPSSFGFLNEDFSAWPHDCIGGSRAAAKMVTLPWSDSARKPTRGAPFVLRRKVAPHDPRDDLHLISVVAAFAMCTSEGSALT